MEARPPAENRHCGAPRGERPASWDAPRLTRAEVASRKRDNNTSAPVGAPPTPRSGWTRKEKIEPRRNNAPRERDVLRGTRPRSGLFDIVKKDGARAMPRAAFAFARGRSHISGSRALRHRRPSASDVQATGAWSETGSDAITVSLQVCSWSHDLIEKPAAFRDHAPAGTTAMTNTQSDEKDGRRVTRLRNRAHPTVSRLGHAGARGTRRATL